jgi:hypothetical protein
MTDAAVVQVPVSPDRAEEILAAMWPSRRPQESLTARIRTVMTGPRWDPSAYPITLDPDGRLVSGQHVLYAVLEIGSPVVVEVIRRASEDEVR